MRIALVGIMIALCVLPAEARGKRGESQQQQQNAQQQKEARAKEEKDYKDALKRIPNQKPTDPWSKVR